MIWAASTWILVYRIITRIALHGAYIRILGYGAHSIMISHGAHTGIIYYSAHSRILGDGAHTRILSTGFTQHCFLQVRRELGWREGAAGSELSDADVAKFRKSGLRGIPGYRRGTAPSTSLQFSLHHHPIAWTISHSPSLPASRPANHSTTARHWVGWCNERHSSMCRSSVLFCRHASVRHTAYV